MYEYLKIEQQSRFQDGLCDKRDFFKLFVEIVKCLKVKSFLADQSVDFFLNVLRSSTIYFYLQEY